MLKDDVDFGKRTKRYLGYSFAIGIAIAIVISLILGGLISWLLQ